MKKNLIMATTIVLAVSSSFASNPAFVLDPAPGSVLKEMNTFILTFPDADVYFEEGSIDFPDVTLSLGDKQWICPTPVKDSSDKSGSSFTIYPSVSDWDYPWAESGSYLLSISNMYMYEGNDKVELDPINVSYSIAYPFEFTLNPPVDQATDLQGMSICFPDLDVTYIPNERIGIATLSGPSGTFNCIVPERIYDEQNGTTLKFTFTENNSNIVPETISAPGTYLLTIRNLSIGSWIYIYYRLPAEGETDIEYMSPAVVKEPSGVYLSWLPEIMLDYGVPDLELVYPSQPENEWDPTVSKVPASLKISGFEEPFYLPVSIQATMEGGGRTPGDEENEPEMYDLVKLDTSSLQEHFNWVLPYGTYTISVPSNIVRDPEGKINPDQILTFYVLQDTGWEEPSVVPPCMVDFEPVEYPASRLSDIHVSWGDILEFNSLATDAILCENDFFSSEEPVALVYGQDICISDDNMYLTIDLSRVQPGNWTVTVPTGYVFIGEDKNVINNELILNYSIVSDENGTHGLTADEDGLYYVCDLKGIHIVTTADCQIIKNLPSGIYLVNGKQILVK